MTTRVWLRRRGAQLPHVEEYLAVAPGWIVDKEKPSFPDVWAAATGQVLGSPLLPAAS